MTYNRNKNEAKIRHLADKHVNGPLSDCLQFEREKLLELENNHKEQLSSIASFRQAEIIPVGKLQTALDESESESGQLSSNEETQSAHQQGIMQETNQFDGSIVWFQTTGVDQQVNSNLVEDLDADVEDLDGNGEEYSHFTEPEDESESRFEESSTFQPEN